MFTATLEKHQGVCRGMPPADSLSMIAASTFDWKLLSPILNSQWKHNHRSPLMIMTILNEKMIAASTFWKFDWKLSSSPMMIITILNETLIRNDHPRWWLRRFPMKTWSSPMMIMTILNEKSTPDLAMSNSFPVMLNGLLGSTSFPKAVPYNKIVSCLKDWQYLKCLYLYFRL